MEEENLKIVREHERFSMDSKMWVQSVQPKMEHADWEKYGFGRKKIPLFVRDQHRFGKDGYWYHSQYYCGAMDVGTEKSPRSVVVLPKVDKLDIAGMMSEAFGAALACGDRDVLEGLKEMSVVNDGKWVVMPEVGTMEWLALFDLFHGILLQVVMMAALCDDLRSCTMDTRLVVMRSLDALHGCGLLDRDSKVLGRELSELYQCTVRSNMDVISVDVMNGVAAEVEPLVTSIALWCKEEEPLAKVPQFAVNMPLLFELWCLRRLRGTCGDGDILYQPAFTLCDLETARAEYGSVHEWRPDILKVGEGLVIDCKYKTTYGSRMRSDDIRQIAGYACLEGVRDALGAGGAREVRSLFLYPDPEGCALDSRDLWDMAVCDRDEQGRDIYHNVRRLGVKVPVLDEYRMASALKEMGMV